MESQKNDLLPVIKNLGYEVPEKYIFGQKITGRDDVRKEERQSLKDLKKACETGEIKAVFISEVSRLSRDSISGRLYLRDFIEMKIPLFFKDISMWTLNPETLEVQTYNNQFIGQLFDQAERELESIKKRTSRGKKQNARDGKVTGAYIKFGYKKDPETKKYLIDENEAAFILDLCNKYITGEYSMIGLTIYANSTGVKTRVNEFNKKGTYTTKSGVVKKASSAIWTTQTVRDLLTNKIYLGERNYSDIVSSVPQIIPEDLYYKIQERLSLNVHYVSKAKHIHLLQRILICGNCGGFYIGHYKKVSNAYYCSAYKTQGIKCNNTSLNYERAEGIIWDFVVNQTYFFKQITGEEKERLLYEQNSKLSELTERRIKYLELKAVEELKVKNLVNMVTEGVFNLEDIRLKKQDIDSLIKSYDSEIMKIDSELEKIEMRIESINNLNLTKSALKHIESNRGLMQEKIKEILDKIVVYKLDDYIALLQVHYLERVYNIIYNYRVQRNRYYFVENDIATFNNPHFQPEEIKEVIKGKVPEFSVTNSNNNTFDGTVFGSYSGKQLIELMDKQGIYRDYERPEKIIPEKIRK